MGQAPPRPTLVRASSRSPPTAKGTSRGKSGKGQKGQRSPLLSSTRTGRGLGPAAPARKARGPARYPKSPARPGLRFPARQEKK